MYVYGFDTLLNSTDVNVDKSFLGISSNDIKSFSITIIYNLLSDFLAHLNYNVVYTDGSVYPLFPDYIFIIPLFYRLITINLSPSTSSFTAEYYTMIESLTHIFSFPPDKFLIASDSMSCLQSLTSNTFNLHVWFLNLSIKTTFLVIVNTFLPFSFFGFPVF